MKDLKEYLKYYVFVADAVAFNCAQGCGILGGKVPINYYILYKVDNGELEIKPVLRRLISMTEDEVIEWAKLTDSDTGLDFAEAHQQIVGGFTREGINYLSIPENKTSMMVLLFHWLISKGFWLFGDDWFNEGIIIDAEIVKG